MVGSGVVGAAVEAVVGIVAIVAVTLLVTPGATAVDLSPASPHEITERVMSNAATTRRIEVFTLAVIVLG